MTSENKFLIGIGAVTVIIIIIGVFFLGKQNKQPQADANFDSAKLIEGAVNTKGKPNSPVVIVEFGDIQCPACRAAQPIANKIVEKNKDNVYFVFRHFPLSIHKNSKLAAQAVEAAGAQGKFFEILDIMYDKQIEWSEKANPRDLYRKYAQDLGLDMDKFNKDMENLKSGIEKDYALGNKAGVESTPTFFINGKKYPGVMQEAQFQQYIDSNLTSVPESSSSATPPGQ